MRTLTILLVALAVLSASGCGAGTQTADLKPPSDPVAYLVGYWEADLPGGAKATMDIKADGTMYVTMTVTQGGQSKTDEVSESWEPVSESKGHLYIKRWTDPAAPRVDDIVFKGKNSFTIMNRQYRAPYHRKR